MVFWALWNHAWDVLNDGEWRGTTGNYFAAFLLPGAQGFTHQNIDFRHFNHAQKSITSPKSRRYILRPNLPSALRKRRNIIFRKSPKNDRIIEDRIIEDRIIEDRIIEDRIIEDRIIDNRGPDNRAGGPDNRGPDNRGPDNRGTDNRGPDNRGSTVFSIFPPLIDMVSALRCLAILLRL